MKKSDASLETTLLLESVLESLQTAGDTGGGTISWEDVSKLLKSKEVSRSPQECKKLWHKAAYSRSGGDIDDDNAYGDGDSGGDDQDEDKGQHPSPVRAGKRIRRQAEVESDDEALVVEYRRRGNCKSPKKTRGAHTQPGALRIAFGAPIQMELPRNYHLMSFTPFRSVGTLSPDYSTVPSNMGTCIAAATTNIQHANASMAAKKSTKGVTGK